jgi:murein DD-endopeptidase MepM/ murein hydrolase activator NlpD
MASDQPTTTPAPFPDSGRPVLWWPCPRQLLVMVLLAVAIVGVPPAAAQDYPPLWLPPVEGGVVEEFAAPPAPWASGHRGVDMAAPAGGEIRSPANGVVSFSGIVVNRQVLSIDHGGGYVSSFEPVESDFEPGVAVSQDQAVAVLGTYDDASHHCDSPCLHWGVRLHGDYINPLLMLGELEPSVLLPLHKSPER